MSVHPYIQGIVLLLFGAYLQAETLYIGLNADMKGGSSQSGEAIRLGAELAIEDINQSGLLGKTKLALLIRDHRGNPARGRDNIEAFAQNQEVIAILGGLHTPVVLHELPMVHQQRIPYLIPWAAGTPIIDNGYTPNFIFRLSVRDEYAGEALVRHALNSKFTKIALLLERTGWGRSNERSMLKASKALDVKVTETQWFNWGETDFKAMIQRMRNNGAQAIMLVANAPEGAEFTKNMAELPASQRLPIISHWGITGGNFVELVGLDALSSVDLRVLQTYLFEDNAHNPLAQSILKRYKHYTGQTHQHVKAIPGLTHSYDFIRLLAIAIKQSSAPTRDLVRSSLENITHYKGLIRTYQYPFSATDHEALDPADYRMAHFNRAGYITVWSP